MIANKSSSSSNCWSNFPDCYQCKDEEVEHCESTLRAWVGARDHYKKFNIVEWEVYKVIFSRMEE